MKKVQRILALVLALSMLMSMAGLSALAEDRVEIPLGEEVQMVAPLGEGPVAVERPTSSGLQADGEPDSATLMAAGEVSGEMTADDFLAQAQGGKIALTGDVTLSAAAAGRSKHSVSGDIAYAIDLNDHSLNFGTDLYFELTDGASMSFTNGSINAMCAPYCTAQIFDVQADSALALDQVTFTTNGCAIYPRGDAATVTVLGSTIQAGCYAVATNASGATNYNVVIALEDSTLSGLAPVMLNVPGQLTMKNCTVNGLTNGVIVRGGTADITGGSIAVNFDSTQVYEVLKTWYADEQAVLNTLLPYTTTNKNWGNGTNLTSGALVVGNRSTGYQYPSDVTVRDVTVTATGNVVDVTFPAVYVNGNEAEGNGAQLSLGGATAVTGPVTNGNDAGKIAVTGGTYDSDVRDYCADGFKAEQNEDGTYGVVLDEASTKWVVSITNAEGTVSYYDTLQAAIAAAKNGDTVQLLQDAAVSGSYLTIAKDITLDLNGKTISGGYLFVSNSKVTVADTSAEKLGKIAPTKGQGIYVRGDNAVLTLNGGLVTGPSYGVRLVSGALRVNGGTVSGPMGIAATGGNVYVESGEVTGTNMGIMGQGDTVQVNVSGGTVTGNTAGIFAKNATVNLSGGTVTGPTAVDMQGGTVTVSDSAQVNGSGYGISLQNYTVSDAATAAKLVMTGGTVNAPGNGQAITGNNNYSQGTVATISGGSVTGGTGIYWPMGGTLTVSGEAHIEGTLAGIEVKQGTVNIEGGTIKATGDYQEYAPSGNGTVGSGWALAVSTQQYGTAVEGVSSDVVVNITGGTLESVNGTGIETINMGLKETNGTISVGGEADVKGKVAAIKTAAGTKDVIGAEKNVGIAVSDGTFSSDVSEYCVEGFKAQMDESTGKYGVVPDEASTKWVASITNAEGTKYYETLQAAVDAAKGGETVEVLHDTTTGAYLNTAKQITVNIPEGVTVSGATYGLRVLGNAKAKMSITGAGTVKGGTYGLMSADGTMVVSGVTVETQAAAEGTKTYGALVQSGSFVMVDGNVTGGTYGIYATGTVDVRGGAVSGNYGIYMKSGSTLKVSGGTVSGGTKPGIFGKQATVELTGGQVKGDVVGLRLYGGTARISGDAVVEATTYGIDLQNATTNDAKTAAKLIMTGGEVRTTAADSNAISGNNLYSAGTVVELSGGKVTTPGVGIYWPMEGTLTISDNAEITAGTGIEARMGTINITGGSVTGNGTYSESAPVSGNATLEGSALLVTTQMYGQSATQYITSPNLVVNITGGALISEQGNAVTVYNTRKNETPADVSISGTATLTGAADKAALVLRDATPDADQTQTDIAVSDGTFSSDVSDYCVEGFKAEKNEDGTYGIVEKDYVAQVGETQYESLQAAINAAAEGGKVELLKSTTESVTVAADKDIVLNIPEGVTLTNKADMDTIVNNGKLKVTGAGTVDNVSHKKAALVNLGTAELTGGTFTRSAEKGASTTDNGGNSYYTVDNQGNLTIDGATVSQTGKYSSLIRNLGAKDDTAKGVLTIKSGSLVGGLNNVKNDDYGTLTIAGGSFTGAEQESVMNWNVAEITGGSFDNRVWNGVWPNTGVGQLTITGGTFTSVVNATNYPGGAVAVSGGTFDAKPADDCLAENYKALENDQGKFVVTIHTTHDWDEGETTKTPTCKEKGEKTFTCTVCGETRTEELDTVDHSLVWEHDASGHWQKCSNCDYVGTTQFHSWSSQQIKAPTCTEKGEMRYTCVLCQRTMTQETNPKGHSYGEPAWTWAEDHTAATATFTCTACDQETEGHAVTETASVTANKTQDADCVKPELTTFVAAVSLGGKSYSDTLTGVQTAQAKGHTTVTDAAVAPTCTETGLSEGSHCSVCNTVLVAQETVAATGHTVVTDAAVAPTCTETGLSAGSHCSVCETVLVAQEVVAAKGHTAVTDAAVAPTCTETGLTEGSHCSTCNIVLVAQETVPATGHTAVTDAAVAPTCTETGLTEGSHCSVCNTVLVAQEVVPATGHTAVTDAAVAPTCTETGLTEGSHCSTCDAVLVAREVVPATGHSLVWEHDDNNHWQKCSNCDHTETAQAHTWRSTGVSGGIRTEVCDICGGERTQRVTTGGGSGGGSRRPTGGNTEVIDDPDVPLAEKPFLFEDVAATDWFYDSVKDAFEKDLMKGTSETRFSPSMSTDRGMIVTMLYRLEKEPESDGTAFPDVAEGKWYTDAVAWAVPAGVAKGYDNGIFGPEDKVTREQLALFLFRYAQLKGYDVTGRGELSAFSDGDSVSDWALEAVEWAVSAGLLKGDNGQLQPQDNATRAETAAVFVRFLQAFDKTETK